MYRLIAFEKNHFQVYVSSKVLERWDDWPTLEIVQDVIDRFDVPASHEKACVVNVDPDPKAIAAIWFELQYCNDRGFFHVDVDDDRNWHTDFPKQDWMVNDERPQGLVV